MNKKDIRGKILAIREKINRRKVDINSGKILKRLFKIREFINAKGVMFYSSYKNEVNTREMIEKAIELNKHELSAGTIFRIIILPSVLGIYSFAIYSIYFIIYEVRIQFKNCHKWIADE